MRKYMKKHLKKILLPFILLFSLLFISDGYSEKVEDLIPVTISKINSENYQYTFDIHGEIKEILPFKQLIRVLYRAKEGDIIILDINTIGGSYEVGKEIIKALKSTDAVTKANMHRCYSMGGIIAFNCQIRVIYTDSKLMVHYLQLILPRDIQQNVLQLKKELDEVILEYNQLIKDTFGKFLKEDEIEWVLQGNEVWLNSTQLQIRMNELKKARDNKK
jgi:ATP-dependent protease ClpP protease subunit